MKPTDKHASDDTAASDENGTPRDRAVKTLVQGDELNQLLAGLLEKKQRRKHQLSIIKDFFENPEKFGVDADDVPHSSSREEILARHKELTYRIALVGSVLRVLKRKLHELDASPFARRGGG